jgi:hypothetical protein
MQVKVRLSSGKDLQLPGAFLGTKLFPQHSDWLGGNSLHNKTQVGISWGIHWPSLRRKDTLAGSKVNQDFYDKNTSYRKVGISCKVN